MGAAIPLMIEGLVISKSKFRVSTSVEVVLTPFPSTHRLAI